MSIYDTLFPNIKRILDSGKDSILPQAQKPVQFGVPTNSSLPTPSLPTTAGNTRQTVKPAPIAQPLPEAPKPVINPLEIIRRGKDQVISQGLTDPKKYLNTGLFEGVFSGTGRKEQTSVNFEQKPFRAKATELIKLSVREKGLIPGIGNLLFEGFNATNAPSPEQYADRLGERVDILTKTGLSEERAWQIAAQDIYNKSPNKSGLTMTGKKLIPQSDLGIELTPGQQKALSGVNLREKFFEVLDAPLFVGSTKPISLALKGKNLLKASKYDSKMTKAVNDFVDLANGLRKVSPEEAEQIRYSAQGLTEALAQKGYIAQDAVTLPEKSLANLLRKHMDESTSAITESSRTPVKPVPKMSENLEGAMDIKATFTKGADGKFTGSKKPEVTPQSPETPKLKPESVSSKDDSIKAKNFKTAEEYADAQTPRIAGLPPSLQGKTVYRGMSEAEWQSIQAGGLSGKASRGGRTFVTTDKSTTDFAFEANSRVGKDSVVVELKPEASRKIIRGEGVGTGLRSGEFKGDFEAKDIGIGDIARVTDKNGKVIYEAPAVGGKTRTQLIDEWKKANTPVNPKLQAFKAGKGNAQSGFADFFAPAREPKKLSEIDRLIAENKVRVVSRDGRDVYQVKKGKEWKSVRDEDSAINQATPKPSVPKAKLELPDELERRLMSVEMAKEALAENPAKQLARFVSKRGDSKGTLAEVTGKQNSKTGIGIDVRTQDLGYQSSEDARIAYEKYATRKAEVSAEEKAVREEVRQYKATAKLKEKTVVPEKAVDRIREIQKIAPEQVRSLEEVSQQIDEVIDLPPNSKPVPLTKIITQTPVENKVHLLDYIRTPDRVLNKIGFGKEAQLLRNQYEKYVIELPKNIDTISEWVKRVPKDASERIFDFLDGKNVKLSGEELKVAEEIRAYLKTWADRLDLPEDNRVTNYITHLFEAELIAKEFDEDLAKIIADKIPGEVYDPFLEKRLGAKGYKRDVWGALDAYTKRATRKVHIDPALEKIRDKAGASLEFTRLEESQFKYIQSYIERVQMRPTYIDNLIDNGIKSLFGYRIGQRPVVFLSRLLRQMTYRGMLGANLGSALRNLSQGINTYAVLGEKYTAIGYAKLLNTSARKELAREGVLAQNFIEDRTLSSTKKALQKADKALWFFFDQAEKINRGAAYFGAKAKGINKGMNETEAVEYAKSIVRKTQFAYDSVDAPVFMGTDVMKTFAQFQTFTLKQTEFLIELAKDTKGLGLIRYALAGFIFVNTVGRAMGMEEKELLPILRFETPPSLKFPNEVRKALSNTPDKYGNIPSTEKKLQNIGKSFLGLVPGGMQAKKTVEGLEMVDKGGSFDAGGRQQFEQKQTTPAKVQTTLFGKYASQNAKDYFDKDTNTGDKDLDRAIKADKEKSATDSERATILTKELQALPKAEAKARLIEIAQTDEVLAEKILDKLAEASLNLSTKDKAIKSLGVANGARADYIAGQLSKLSSNAEKKAYLAELAKKKLLTDEVLDQVLERIK